MDRILSMIGQVLGRLDARDAALAVWGLTATTLNSR